MEKVQFQQEQMLAELKDLAEKGLFTQKEIKQILKKRTAFETALVRRVARKGDYLRYAAYEMGLEALRKKRVERMNLPPSAPSISDYALVRRQFHIFERALKKFQADVGLWIQYIQLAKREGARALVGRIMARALQLHPTHPPLYILAAAHELSSHSPSAARTLLQRGLRLNGESVEMWREYVRMEMGFVEGMRRRWEVLGIGIEVGSDGVGGEKGKGKGREEEGEGMDVDGEEEKEKDEMVLEVEKEDEEGEEARRAIMNGQIVKSVISSAAQALPKLALFQSLQSLISTYPSPASLRESLLDHLYTTLRTTLPHDAEGVKLYATRSLLPYTRSNSTITTTDATRATHADAQEGDEGSRIHEPGFVDALRSANEELVRAVKEVHSSSTSELQSEGKEGKEAMAKVYVSFVKEWCARGIDANLKSYLLSHVQLLARTHDSPALLAAHIELELEHITQSETETGAIASSNREKVLRHARKYSARSPTTACVWLARLEAEQRCGREPQEVRRAWTQARREVRGDGEMDVWLWGLGGASKETLEELVRESMGDSRLMAVHEELLVRYVAAIWAEEGERISDVRHIGERYLPSGRVWAAVFGAEAAAGGTAGTGRVLEEVYERWRGQASGEATMAWAGWLLGHKRGREAKTAVMRVDEADKGRVCSWWASVVD